MSKTTAPDLLVPPPAPVPGARRTRRRLPVWAWILIGIAAAAIVLLLSPVFAVVSLVVLITGIVALSRGTRTWLRFSNRISAAWATAVAAIVLLATGSVTGAMRPSAPAGDAVAFVAATASPAARVAGPTRAATPTPTPTPTESPARLISVVDGDTIETDAGTVRLIGIDTPERDAWGYDESAAALTAFLATGPLTLARVDGRDDVDQYGRLLRYVRVNGQDAGRHMIGTGWAIARYDGRDGYGTHPLQAEYITLDAAHEVPAQPAPEPAPAEPAPFVAPAEPAAPAPGAPATDPRFGTCREANAAGYGNYQSGVDPGYSWYQDRDHDGWVCEF